MDRKKQLFLKSPDLKGPSLSGEISTKAQNPPRLTACVKWKACLGEYA